MKLGYIVFAISFLFVLLVASCNSEGQKPASSNAEIGAFSNKHVAAFTLNGKCEIGPRREPATGGLEEFYPCDKELRAGGWPAMTPRERMLANGWEELKENGQPYDPPKQHYPVHKLVSMMANYYHHFGKIPTNVDDLVACGNACIGDKAAEYGVEDMNLKSYFEENLISPVTGEALTWNNPNFSAGNVFVTVVDENPGALQKVDAFHSQIAKQINATSKLGGDFRADDSNDRFYIYVRVYGTSGVIDRWYEEVYWNAPDAQSPDV